ncbi:MAG: 23S rRNA (adenine(2503)-C(2))-methyltransferase RlmN [Candidatus Rokuibacteriota bacterium]|nr:MAG: 23S rRNA (adenine(2503)-C(2))-methyltransferase RlmN [Candidatus Rokubacteria bacterium]
MSLINLLDLLPDELESLAESLGAPRYRGRQLAGWMYQKQVTDVLAMSDLPRPFREALTQRATVAAPDVERCTPSRDGSRKFVFRYDDGARVQSVLMPDGERLTLCVSTQVGCGFGCAFCYTGTMGLDRNLGAGEIIGQVLAAARTLPSGQRLTHIVYMGMGEPLANYSATVKSLRLLTDPRAFGFSPRRITVSTVGLVGGIEKLAQENLRVNLAISLHATDNAIRDRLMPVNRGFAIEELLAACRRFPLPFRQRMTFEYVLLDGVNDAPEHAHRLVRLLKGIRAKINLIPFNDWDGARFSRPPLSRILAFQGVLLEHGITATVRWSKGDDIGAACGQLREAVPA